MNSFINCLRKTLCHVPPYRTEMKNEWIYNSTHPYALVALTGTNLPLPLPCKKLNTYCLLDCILHVLVILTVGFEIQQIRISAYYWNGVYIQVAGGGRYLKIRKNNAALWKCSPAYPWLLQCGPTSASYTSEYRASSAIPVKLLVQCTNGICLKEFLVFCPPLTQPPSFWCLTTYSTGASNLTAQQCNKECLYKYLFSYWYCEILI